MKRTAGGNENMKVHPMQILCKSHLVTGFVSLNFECEETDKF